MFSVTSNAAGTAALSYNNSNGVFSYTPPDLSSYLTAEADTLDTVTGRGATTSNNITAGNLICSDAGQFSVGTSQYATLGYNAAGSKVVYNGNNSNFDVIADQLDYYSGATLKATLNSTGLNVVGSIVGTSLTAGGLTYPTSNGTSGQVLTSDGAGSVTWTAGGLQSRATTGVTQSIAGGASADVSITAPSGYALLAIETSHAAWVTLYSDTSSRTLDATRAITNDPLPGSGVLAEVITTGAATQKVTPGIICFNSTGAGQNTTYAKIENRSGSTNNITVTLTYITLEA